MNPNKNQMGNQEQMGSQDQINEVYYSEKEIIMLQEYLKSLEYSIEDLNDLEVMINSEPSAMDFFVGQAVKYSNDAKGLKRMRNEYISMKDSPKGISASSHQNGDHDNCIITIALKGNAVFEMEVPKSKYDRTIFEKMLNNISIH